MNDLKGLTPRPVATEQDALDMATLRNVCREGFSNSTDPIGADQQRAWWAANQHVMRAWLYFVPDLGPVGLVGFGLLRPHEVPGALATVVAVLPKWAGRGFGGAITRHLVREAGDARVLATARRDNPAACRLHDADYWHEVPGPNAQLMYFRAKRPEERTA